MCSLQANRYHLHTRANLACGLPLVAAASRVRERPLFFSASRVFGRCVARPTRDRLRRRPDAYKSHVFVAAVGTFLGALRLTYIYIYIYI
jgi:hypothetical protein